MKKPITEITRIRIEEFPDIALESTERVVHLSPTVIGRVFALRGVASSDIDVVVTDDVESPIDDRDVLSLECNFGERAVGLTLAEANRLASRELYGMARAAGWRKLTLREQTALGLEGQWHRDDVVAERRASRAVRSGCGERTLLAASMAAHIDTWLDGNGNPAASR